MKKISIILLMLFIPLYLSAKSRVTYGKIKFVVGKVNIKRVEGKVEKATINKKVYEGDEIITGSNGAAQILLRKGIQIRIAKNSVLKIKKNIISDKGKNTRLNVSIGKIWIRIKDRLGKNDKFKVETPTAVVGVRGTIFVVEANNNGTTLYVAKGLVSFVSKLIGKEILVKKNFMAMIDKNGNIKNINKMSKSDKEKMMNGIPIFIKNNKNKKRDLKSILKSEINKEKRNIYRSRRMIANLKNEDLKAGRTLYALKFDENGKIIGKEEVRVEQIFRRKGKNSLQLLNLTKHENELVYVDITVRFDKDLSDNLSDISKYFISDDSSIQVVGKEVRIGAKRKSKLNDEIKWISTYDKDSDEWDDTVDIRGKVTKTGLKIKPDELKDIEEGDSSLYKISELQLYENDGVTPYKTIKIQMYIIDNNGEILSENNLKDNDNFFKLIKNIAGQILIKQDDILNGDINIVTTPDIGFVIIQDIL